MTVVRIIGLVNGGTSAYDGQFVVEYDPSRDGVEPGTGRGMNCHLVTTPERAAAAEFEPREAFELLRKVDPRQPTRPDGRPNRPLTAFTCELLTGDG